jgi:hypothetical protein
MQTTENVYAKRRAMESLRAGRMQMGQAMMQGKAKEQMKRVQSAANVRNDAMRTRLHGFERVLEDKVDDQDKLTAEMQSLIDQYRVIGLELRRKGQIRQRRQQEIAGLRQQLRVGSQQISRLRAIKMESMRRSRFLGFKQADSEADSQVALEAGAPRRMPPQR